MACIIRFPNSGVRELRKRCRFKNKDVQVKDEYGGSRKYPCIVLYEEETDIPIIYTGLERYLRHLAKSELLSEKTLSVMANGVCKFLNYLLKETDINTIHECNLVKIRDGLRFMRARDDGSFYARETWMKYTNYVINFLVMYYMHNRDSLFFNYTGEELMERIIIEDEKHRRRVVIDCKASLHILKPPIARRKNRVLVEGYLDLLMYEAKKYEPDIVLGIALGAYAGMRAGEIVNVSCGAVQVIRRSFGMLSDIEIDLLEKAPYFRDRKWKTDPGSIKKNRKQKIYRDFVMKFNELYEIHIARMEIRGMDISSGAPLFVNKQGRPMTVQTYSERLKKLFYERFLPGLKYSCEKQGTYADNVAFIEAYEKEYPGAHMFRHWYTMYLLTKAKLTAGEIMKWRGDSSQESMNDYIHENEDLIEIYRESAYAFQSKIMEDI